MLGASVQLGADVAEILDHFHRIVVQVWRKEAPQAWRDAIITVLHKKKDHTSCDNCRGIVLVTRAGKVLLRIFMTRLSNYFKVARAYCRRSTVGSGPLAPL